MLYLFAALLAITVKSQIPCTVDSDCTDIYGTESGWSCDGSVCIPATCTQDDQCSGSNPICSTTLSQCVACRVTSDCTSNTDNYGAGFICIAGGGYGACIDDTDTTTTDTCTSNTDCSTELPFCDTSTGNCGVCLVDADCVGNVLCSTSTCTCDDAGSIGSIKFCNPSDIQEPCDTDEDCSSYAPYCDPTLKLCQGSITNGCTGDQDCPDTLPTCLDGGICINEDTTNTCESADQCSIGHPLCNTDTGYCYACDTDQDCEDNIIYGSGSTCDWITVEGITVSVCCQQGDDECGDGITVTMAPTKAVADKDDKTSDSDTTAPTGAPTPSPTGLVSGLPSSKERYVIIVAHVIILALVSWM